MPAGEQAIITAVRVTGAWLAFLVCVSSPARAQTERKVGVVVSLRVNVGSDQATALAKKLGDFVSAQLAVEAGAASVDRRPPPVEIGPGQVSFRGSF